MAKLLSKRLSKNEYISLFLLMDEDGPAGPLYSNVGDVAVKLAPELFKDTRLPDLKPEAEDSFVKRKGGKKR